MVIERPCGSVFFVGAGVSSDCPSCLPRADKFAGEIFDLLCTTGEVYLTGQALLDLRAAIQRRLRLEVFLETLASKIPPPTAFSPFTKFNHAEPNTAHFAIAALAKETIITTNQDLLLEGACKRLGLRRRVIHLHGNCDRVASIITIISQYLGGLERRVRRGFEAAIRGKKIIVVGYSGRDLDIMPILVKGHSAAIKWILHKSGSPSPELVRACEILGSRIEIIPAYTSSWLNASLTKDDQLRIASLRISCEPKRLPMPESVRYAFTTIAPATRNWAVAKVLEQLGRHEQALMIYQRLATDPSVDQPQLRADLGRAAARVSGHETACQIFTSVLERPKISAETRASVLLGRLDALRNSSHPVEALRDLAELDRVLKAQRKVLLMQDRGKRYWHFLGWGLSAKAGIRRIEGCAVTAARLYARAARAFSRARDIDGRIEVLTWQAESLLKMGDYAGALATADQAIADAVAYAKDLVRGWPWYVRAEALALSGRCDDALKDAAKASKILRASRNIQGPLWCLLLYSDCFREKSPSKAARVLSAVRKALRAHKLAHVQARLYLEEAELARGAVNWPRLNRALVNLRAHLANRTMFTGPPWMLMAHALLIEAEAARQQGDDAAASLLRGVRDAYQRIGAMSFVARANVGLVLAGEPDVLHSVLLAHCRHYHYGFEVQRLEGVRTGFYPIHFV